MERLRWCGGCWDIVDSVQVSWLGLELQLLEMEIIYSMGKDFHARNRHIVHVCPRLSHMSFIS